MKFTIVDGPSLSALAAVIGHRTNTLNSISDCGDTTGTLCCQRYAWSMRFPTSGPPTVAGSGISGSTASESSHIPWAASSGDSVRTGIGVRVGVGAGPINVCGGGGTVHIGAGVDV